MRLKITLLATGLVLMLYGFHHEVHAADDPSAEIRKLQQLRGSAELKPEVVQLRSSVIKEAAYVLGVQSGVCWQHDLRIKALEEIAPSLDRIFNFSPLLIHGDVLPPIIIEAGPGLRIENKTTATSVIKHYKILFDAQFISTPPNWRTYLAQPFEKAENINPVVLPKTGAEEELWKEHVRKGFHDGIRQADLVFETQLNTLVRDYSGVIRFHALARQGILAMPEVSRGNCDITVNGKELKIGERVFRVSGTQFTKVEAWKPR